MVSRVARVGVPRDDRAGELSRPRVSVLPEDADGSLALDGLDEERTRGLQREEPLVLGVVPPDGELRALREPELPADREKPDAGVDSPLVVLEIVHGPREVLVGQETSAGRRRVAA